MKRIFIALFLVLSLVICLPACNPTIDENLEFAKFNQMFANGFENYTITVSTTSLTGDMLNNNYVVTTVNGERKVAYKTEKLNGFTIENGVITSEGYKSVSEGVYNAVESASASFDVPKFDFSNKWINNHVIASDSFDAKIMNITSFMGLDVKASNASFHLSYSENGVESMKVTYVTETGNTVVITYTFN